MKNTSEMRKSRKSGMSIRKLQNNRYRVRTVRATYEVREYHKGDEEQIIELLEQAFQYWPGYNIQKSKLDFWTWKYIKENNLRGIVVAESQGKIVGCGHGVNREIKIGNGLYLMRFGGDVAVHQD